MNTAASGKAVILVPDEDVCCCMAVLAGATFSRTSGHVFVFVDLLPWQVGIGADEFMGGYSRHRNAYRRGGERIL